MKKLIFAICLSFLFFTNSIFSQSQKWEFGVTLKSNFTTFDIEDEIYDSRTLVTGSLENWFYKRTPKKAYRTVNGKLGLEGGVLVKYDLFANFSLISGIEGRLIRYDVSQEIEQEVEPLLTLLGILPIPGEPYGAIQGAVINRDNNGNIVKEGEEAGIFNFTNINQNLFYLNIPFNIGYSTKSEKLTFFGGFWYSYLLTADIEESDFFPNEPISYFNKNIIGVNAGIELKVNSQFAISLNYSGLSSNFYYKTKTIVVTSFNNNMVEFKKKEVQNPASKGFNLFSLGLTYKL